MIFWLFVAQVSGYEKPEIWFPIIEKAFDLQSRGYLHEIQEECNTSYLSYARKINTSDPIWYSSQMIRVDGIFYPRCCLGCRVSGSKEQHLIFINGR